jgi:hypothetical protein
MSQLGPQVTADRRKHRADRRSLVATLLVTGLIAVAYQEAVTAAREAVLHDHRVTVGTGILFFVFFVTSMRFFIGNYLHMQGLAEADLPGPLWLYDLIFITLQTVLLVFLGSASSVDVSSTLQIGFVALLISLYILDVLWILSQWIVARFSRAWTRHSYPWPWLFLNGIQVALIWGLGAFAFGGDYYSVGMLWCLAVISAIAFIIDVILIDRSGVLQ